MVIAADGVHGVVARALGLARPPHELVALDTTEESPELVPADAATMYVAYGYAGGPGYGYVFPKRGCVDAGVGFLVGFFRGSGRSPRAWHARFVEDAGCRGWLAGPSSPARVRAWHLPLAGPLPRTVTDRAVVCGDAGGFVNAYTGEGIYYAMVTGEHAGAAAMAALREGAPSAAALASYERRWRAEVGAELADSRRIQRHLFRHPGLVDALIRGAAADGRLRELLAQVALGEARFRRCAWAVALRLARAELRRRWPGGRRRGGVRS
jgi:flavin-dependent dehydrogenase